MKQEEIRRARQKLVGDLPNPAEIVRGSLLDRKIFHRQGCVTCRRGQGHRVWVLNVGYPGGRTRQFTVRPEQRAQVERWLKNYQNLKSTLEAICELNHELLRAES